MTTDMLNVKKRYSRHGLYKHPLYRTWTMMFQRCNNANRSDYKYYGGRGIKVCNRWNYFPDFVKDMSEKPSPQHTLDRIDAEGNYEPSNCRWATKTQQMLNTRMRKDNTSGVRGVTWSKQYSRWIARKHLCGKQIHLGTFKNLLDAEKRVQAWRHP